MKKPLSACLLFLICLKTFGQIRREPTVKLSLKLVDSLTGKSLPYANIGLLKGQRMFSSGKGGTIDILFSPSSLSDSLYCAPQNYLPKKIKIGDYAGKPGTVKFKPLQNTHTDFRLVRDVTKETLNGFRNGQVKNYAGIPTPNSPFALMQIGQVFRCSHDTAVISRIKLSQLFFDLPNYVASTESKAFWTSNDFGGGGGSSRFSRSFDYNFIQQSIFRLRFYTVDENTRLPVRELTDMPITVENTGREMIAIGLENKGLLLTKGLFCVAVELISRPENFSYVREIKREDFEVVALRPFIGVYLNSKELRSNIVGLDYGGNWKRVDDFLPFANSLAMEIECAF